MMATKTKVNGQANALLISLMRNL